MGRRLLTGTPPPYPPRPLRRPRSLTSLPTHTARLAKVELRRTGGRPEFQLHQPLESERQHLAGETHTRILIHELEARFGASLMILTLQHAANHHAAT